jgi:hypothetical protein
MSATSSRRGYAMILVLIFIALVNLCLVLSYKHLDAAIRVENVYRQGTEADEGTILSLAAGLALLEVETPTQSGNYEYKISFGNSLDEAWYTVTYTLQSSTPGGVETWSVAAVRPDYPNDSLPDLRDRIQELAANPPPPPTPPGPVTPPHPSPTL